MAYVDGTSLDRKIRERPLKLDEALDVAIQTAEGLQAAHEKGIVHRDIKSSNVLLTKKGEAKITNFGALRTTPISRYRGLLCGPRRICRGPGKSTHPCATGPAAR
jgi:serine/threonine protein kinase